MRDMRDIKKLILKYGTQIKQSPKKMHMASLKVNTAPEVVTLDSLEVSDRATANEKANGDADWRQNEEEYNYCRWKWEMYGRGM